MKDVKDILNVTSVKLKINLINFYKKQYHTYNSLLEKNLINFFSSLFLNCLDFKSFRHSIDKILLRSNPSQQIYPSVHLSNHFSLFLGDKIKTLPLNLALIKVNPHSVPNNHYDYSDYLNQHLMKLSNLYYLHRSVMSLTIYL